VSGESSFSKKEDKRKKHGKNTNAVTKKEVLGMCYILCTSSSV
jgi:hypothetical protein